MYVRIYCKYTAQHIATQRILLLKTSCSYNTYTLTSTIQVQYEYAHETLDICLCQLYFKLSKELFPIIATQELL